MNPADFFLQSAKGAAENIVKLSDLPEKRGFLPHNFRGYLRAASGYSLLCSSDLLSYVENLREFDPIPRMQALLDFQATGEFPTLFHSFTADDADLLAIPIALGHIDVAETYLREFLLRASSIPIWRSFVEGINSLLSRSAFAAAVPSKTKGMERHWILYLRLLEDICAGREQSDICDQIAQSFDRCNRDGRLADVTHIDPSGTHPAPWDLRLAYIEKAFSTRQIKGKLSAEQC